MFALAGFTPHVGGRLSFAYIASLLLLDATLLIALIFWLLRRRGEHPRDVFLGARPVAPKSSSASGSPPSSLRWPSSCCRRRGCFFPSLHNVKDNPLQDLIQSPAQAFFSRSSRRSAAACAKKSSARSSFTASSSISAARTWA